MRPKCSAIAYCWSHVVKCALCLFVHVRDEVCAQVRASGTVGELKRRFGLGYHLKIKLNVGVRASSRASSRGFALGGGSRTASTPGTARTAADTAPHNARAASSSSTAFALDKAAAAARSAQAARVATAEETVAQLEAYVRTFLHDDFGVFEDGVVVDAAVRAPTPMRDELFKPLVFVVALEHVPRLASLLLALDDPVWHVCVRARNRPC
jgi:hypothetical protein